MSFMKGFGKDLLQFVDDAGAGLLNLLEPYGLTRQYQDAMQAFSASTIDKLCQAAMPYKAIDFEKYIPKEGAALIASNHNSEWDVIMNAMVTKQTTQRQLWQMAKHSLFKIPVVNAWIRTHFAFPLRRGESDKDSVDFAMDLLSKGELVGMYPEGTTNEGKGNLLPPHVGVMRIAIEADVPIIPIGITGTENIFPKNAKMLNIGRSCILRVGKPFNKHRQYCNKYPRPEYEILHSLTEELMTEIKGLLYYDNPI